MVIELKAKSNPMAFWMHTPKYMQTKTEIASFLDDPKDKDSMTFSDTENPEILLKQNTMTRIKNYPLFPGHHTS